jgi:opacity protein-like surface antigen
MVTLCIIDTAAAVSQDQLSSFQAGRSFYYEGDVGTNFISDRTDSTIDLNAEHISVNTGYIASLHVGYAFRNGARLEVEDSYRENSVGKIFLPMFPGSTNVSGRIISSTVLTNALYDIKTSTNFVPYVGFGCGAMWITQRAVGNFFANNSQIGTIFHNGTSLVPAVQAEGGFNIALTPIILATIDYHYLQGFNVKMNNNLTTESTKQGINNHSISFGIHYTFGSPEF